MKKKRSPLKRFIAAIVLIFIFAFGFHMKITLFQVHSGLQPERHFGGSTGTDIAKIGNFLYFENGTPDRELVKSAVKGGEASERLGIQEVYRLQSAGNLLYVQYDNSPGTLSKDGFAVYDAQRCEMILNVDLDAVFEKIDAYPEEMGSVDAKGAYFSTICEEGEKMCFVSTEGEVSELKSFPKGMDIDLLAVDGNMLIYNLYEDPEERVGLVPIGLYSWNKETREEKLLSSETRYSRHSNDGISTVWNNRYISTERYGDLRIIPLDGSEEEKLSLPSADRYCFDQGMIYGADRERVIRYSLETGKAEYAEVKGKTFSGEIDVIDGNLIISIAAGSPFSTMVIYCSPVNHLKWKALEQESF